VVALRSLNNCPLLKDGVVCGNIKIGFWERLIGISQQANNRDISNLFSKERNELLAFLLRSAMANYNNAHLICH